MLSLVRSLSQRTKTSPWGKVLPSNVCIKNFDFHNQRNSRNITGTDPRNRSILKHAWYPFRISDENFGHYIFFPSMANSWYSLPRSRFLGCVTSQKRLRGRLANSWTSSGVGKMTCEMTRSRNEKKGKRFSILPVSLLISLSCSVRREHGNTST